MMTSVSWPIHMKLETRFLLAAFKRWLAFNWIFIWLCLAFQHFPILTWVLSAKTTTIRVILFESSCSITFKWSKPWSRFNFIAKVEKWKSAKVQKCKSGKVELAGSSSPPQHCRLAAPEVVQGRSHCWPRSLPKPRIYNCHHWYQFINIILILVRYHNYSMQTLLFHMQSLCGQQKHKTSPTRAKPSCKSKWWYIGNY